MDGKQLDIGTEKHAAWMREHIFTIGLSHVAGGADISPMSSRTSRGI